MELLWCLSGSQVSVASTMFTKKSSMSICGVSSSKAAVPDMGKTPPTFSRLGLFEGSELQESNASSANTKTTAGSFVFLKEKSRYMLRCLACCLQEVRLYSAKLRKR